MQTYFSIQVIERFKRLSLTKIGHSDSFLNAVIRNINRKKIDLILGLTHLFVADRSAVSFPHTWTVPENLNPFARTVLNTDRGAVSGEL